MLAYLLKLQLHLFSLWIFYLSAYFPVWTSVIKYLRLGGLNNKNLFFDSSQVQNEGNSWVGF